MSRRTRSPTTGVTVNAERRGPPRETAPQGVQKGSDGGTEKLQKVLARAGLGSRRELEQWIENGRVSVNGSVATLGDRVGGDDQVSVDGRTVRLYSPRSRRTRVIRYHKPAGEVCTRRDPEGRPTVFERLPGLRGRRWIMVGRLDVSTSGLLLFTDNGELAHRLMHPSTEMEREYAVRVYGELSPETLQRLRDGVPLDDGTARFDALVDAGGEGRNHWYRVTVREGRNRLVRRLWESQSVEVSRLIRVRYGAVELPRRLRAGRWDELDDDQVKTLMGAAGIKPEPPPELPTRSPGRGRGPAPPRGRGGDSPAGNNRSRRSGAPGRKPRG